MTLTDQFRRAIQTCGKTRYRIAQESGVEQGTLSRLMAGRAVSSDTLDALAAVLKLEVKRSPRRPGK